MMNTLKEAVALFAQALTILAPHGAGIGWMIIALLVGIFMNTRVFTKQAHYVNRPVWFWWWGRKTLPLHPVIAGSALGYLWPQANMTPAGSMMYFAAWGGGAVFFYEATKGFLKQKGVDLSSMPGED